MKVARLTPTQLLANTLYKRPIFTAAVTIRICVAGDSPGGLHSAVSDQHRTTLLIALPSGSWQGEPRHSGLQPPPPLPRFHPTPALTKVPIEALCTKQPIHPDSWGLLPLAAPRALVIGRVPCPSGLGSHPPPRRQARRSAGIFSHAWHPSVTSHWPCPPAARLDWRLPAPMGGAASCRSGRRLDPRVLVGAGSSGWARPSFSSGRSLGTASGSR